MKAIWQKIFTWIQYCGSPARCYQLLTAIFPYCAILAVVLLAYGLWTGLFVAPADYQQSDAFRIIYIHVPAAFLSMFVYVFMATAAAIGLIWRIKVAHAFARSSAIIGASFTALALVTGSIWGKPMWGTWWIWDARLTSELILLFLYMGFIALGNAIPDQDKSARASAILAVLGVVNIPIIHFSVNWWYTLHQGATLSRFAKPAMDNSMLWPLLAMIAGFFAFFFAVLSLRVRGEILWRERNSNWVKKLGQTHG